MHSGTYRIHTEAIGSVCVTKSSGFATRKIFFFFFFLLAGNHTHQLTTWLLYYWLFMIEQWLCTKNNFMACKNTALPTTYCMYTASCLLNCDFS